MLPTLEAVLGADVVDVVDVVGDGPITICEILVVARTTDVDGTVNVPVPVPALVLIVIDGTPAIPEHAVSNARNENA